MTEYKESRETLAFRYRNLAMDAVIDTWRTMWDLYRDTTKACGPNGEGFDYTAEHAYERCRRALLPELRKALEAEEALCAIINPQRKVPPPLPPWPERKAKALAKAEAEAKRALPPP